MSFYNGGLALHEFPAGTLGERDPSLDHGTLIPLYYICKKYTDFKLVRIGLSGLPLALHYQMGQIIQAAVNKTGRKVVYVASGDLSHKMKEDGPSMDYRARLESAYEYLVKNPETKVITTGARGDFEPVSEAKGGADYLIKKGISSDRIIMEDKSYDTLQNLSNAYDLIVKDGKDPKEIKTVIVSALYHLYRASYIAEKIGYRNISCKGGHGLMILLPHYYTREFFALIKEWIVL